MSGVSKEKVYGELDNLLEIVRDSATYTNYSVVRGEGTPYQDTQHYFSSSISFNLLQQEISHIKWRIENDR